LFRSRRQSEFQEPTFSADVTHPPVMGNPMASNSKSLRLLDPETLGEIGNLELLSRRVVDGYLSGRHRSTFKGGCFEFAEHRAYSPGDESRLIDWRVYAKTDRYYIKQFEEETNLQAVMLLDASGSMQFGLSTASKFDYARTAAACLSRLMLRGRDSVGLALATSGGLQYIPPRNRAQHLAAMLAALQTARPHEEAALAPALDEVGRRIRRRGLILVFSDCFSSLDDLQLALHHLRHRGHEVMLFHTLAPEEVNFQFAQWSRFQCLEDASWRIDLDPAVIRDRYLERFAKFEAELKSCCHETNCDYVRLTTDQDLGGLLAEYLRRRTAQIKR
jgi:uncharacterized protein (DUF58 family)